MEKMERGVAAVDRAFLILKAIIKLKQASLSDIAKETQLYKSTILRLLESLDKAGATCQLKDSKYAIGPLGWQLVNCVDPYSIYQERILGVLQTLIDAGSESASFHVKYSPTERICLYRIDSFHSTLDNVRAGAVLPLDRGAAGRVIGKYSGNDEGGNESGDVVVSIGERDGSCAAVAIPVFGTEGRFLGAVSLSGPRERFTEIRIEEMSKLLRNALKSFNSAVKKESLLRKTG